MNAKCAFFGFFCALFLFSGLSWAAGEATSVSSIPALSSADSHPYSQLFTIEAGPFRPTAVSVSNSNAQYDYTGSSLNSYLVEPGWSLKLFHLLGAVSLQESLALSMFKANLPNQADSISLFALGVDTRLRHSWEWFPVRAIIPFVEGGYQYTFYSQSGPSDFESAQGAVGNFVAGGGVDLWVNAMLGHSVDEVNRYSAIPVFVTAKINYVAPSASSVNLGSTSFLAGLSIGI